MVERHEIKATIPDIVFTGMGRFHKSYLPESENTLSFVLDIGQTTNFPFMIFNDTDSTMDIELSWQALLSDGWSLIIKDAIGHEISSPHELSIAENYFENFTLSIINPLSHTPENISTILLFAKQKTETGNLRDSFKIVFATNLATVSDVKTHFEFLLRDESIHPVTAEITADTFIKEVIAEESDKILSFSKFAIQGRKFPFYKLARKIIVTKCAEQLLRKAAAYTLGGEMFYISLIENMEKEHRKDTQNLQTKLFARSLTERALRRIETDATVSN